MEPGANDGEGDVGHRLLVSFHLRTLASFLLFLTFDPHAVAPELRWSQG